MRRRYAFLPLAGLFVLSTACGGGEIGGSDSDGECGEGDFVCGDGSCVEPAQECNGSENCPDGTDEDNCVTRCERTDYRCKDGNTCVARGALCDGRSDCPGGDDESTCAAKECDGFECGDGTCVEPADKCNGTNDCAGGEDESAVTCAPVNCPNADDLRCTDGRTCVTKAQQCDGTRHCPRGEDEGIKMCADGSGDPDGDGKGEGGSGDPNRPKPGGGGGPDKPGGGGGSRPCGDVSEEGVCKEDQLVWCDHGRLERTDCRADGKTCGRNADGNNACLDMDGEPEADCGSMPETGSCQGSTLLFCTEAGEPRSEDCAASGEQCVTDETGSRCAPAPGLCGDIDYQGRCNGQVVEWCNEAGELESYDCDLGGMTCAWLDAEIGYGCQSAPCGELTYYGECDGDTLRYCSGDTNLIEVDCRTEYGLGCGLQDDEIGYNCGGGESSEGGSSCGDITASGTCDGDWAIWCNDEGSISEYDCSVQGKTCGWYDDEVGYWCVSSGGGSACGDIDYEGTCEGDWAVWCENDQLQYVDCSFDGGCGYVGDGYGYYCVGDGGGDGGGSEVTSCDGWCGVGEVPGSNPVCYCDDACVENGDCCGGAVEYDYVCGYEEEPEPDYATCDGWCGYDEPAPGSNPACYCDDYCYENGDCCSDVDYYCY